MQIPKQVLVTDVVARDGFQNEDRIVSTEDKLRVVEGLAQAGVTSIEVTSFVHPGVVPQLADAAEVVARLPHHEGVIYSALVPNIKGARRALDAGVTELHLVVSASESHNRANLNRSVPESLAQLAEVCFFARDENPQVMLVTSIATAFHCPFEGRTPIEQVFWIIEELVGMGIRRINLADTDGAANPLQVSQTTIAMKERFPEVTWSLHLHNTRDMGLANALAGLQAGQHIELGISEMNLFLLLGQLGLSYELCGQQLFPIGTVYDPFVCRGLDALIYGLYSGAKFIFAGTPSGVSLSREGGAHQSTVTASLGIELPELDYYEPAFACELEWILLQALRECCNRTKGRSTYLRLSTKKIEQRLLEPVLERLGREELRRQVLAGGYRLLEGRSLVPDALESEVVQIATTGVMLPEAVEAAHRLAEEGIAANVLHLTSPKKLFTLLTEERRRLRRDAYATIQPGHLQTLFPRHERKAPIVTVQDASAHSLSFLGGLYGVPTVPLGVDRFGQSGSQVDLYQYTELGENS